MHLTKSNAHKAGLLYLSIAVFGIFAHFFVRTPLLEAPDAATAATMIADNPTLFRLGFVADVLSQLSHFFLVLLLYRMFKEVNSTAARLMLACVLVSVSISFLNLLNMYAALQLALPGITLTDFAPAQQQALSAFFLQLHDHGYNIAGIFFGLWLYPLGLMAKQSGRIPKIIGYLLMLGCFGYMLEFLVEFLFPQYPGVAIPGLILASAGEFSFLFYILIKGLKQEPKALATA